MYNLGDANGSISQSAGNSRVKNSFSKILGNIKARTTPFSRKMREDKARLWLIFYKAIFLFDSKKKKRGWIGFLLFESLLIVFELTFASALQRMIEPYLFEKEAFENFKDLLLNLGTALVGATAIAFSLIVFAMQVNVERMPHGLFRSLSNDWRILAAFIGTFCLSASIACGSLTSSTSWVGPVIIGVLSAILLIFSLFLYAFTRALTLINPLEQLQLLINASSREMKIWVKRAARMSPLYKVDSPEENPSVADIDLRLLTFFNLHPYWISKPQQAIEYASSFARRYAEHGDSEVSAAALRAIVIINRRYVEAKGRTFFSDSYMVENPFSRDKFINNTLEILRQNLQRGIASGNEDQIVQSLEAFEDLVGVYLNIQYPTQSSSRTHGQLAATYLATGVEDLVPHGKDDVILTGIRLMGRSAQRFIECGHALESSLLVEKIGVLGCLGLAKEKYRPITLTAVEKLAQLTISLFRCTAGDSRYAIKKVMENLGMIAIFTLKIPDNVLASVHSQLLSPYYSGTKTNSLLQWLSDLVNTLGEAPAEDVQAQKVVRNIEQWSDGIYQSQKELLLLGIEKRSHFTFDVIHWTTFTTQILLAISNASACPRHTKEKLQKNAFRLISTLSWIPDDKETVAYIETLRLGETLFEAAIDAHNRDCPDVVGQIQKMIFGWAFKSGKYQTGWGSFENGIYALFLCALLTDGIENLENVKRQVSDRLRQPGAPNKEIRDRTAHNLREKAESLYSPDRFYYHSSIEQAMHETDHSVLIPLLIDVADILSRNTPEDPPHHSPAVS